MTKQKYLLWTVDGTLKARNGNDVLSLRWHPGREAQLTRLLAQWELEDEAVSGSTAQALAVSDAVVAIL